MKNRDIMHEVSKFTPSYCHCIDSIFSSEKWDSNRTYLFQLLGGLNEVQHGAWQVMVGGQKPHSQSACRLVGETRGGKKMSAFFGLPGLLLINFQQDVSATCLFLET